jgi:hemerythrin
LFIAKNLYRKNNLLEKKLAVLYMTLHNILHIGGNMSNETVVWSDAYSIGFEPLDAQHKELVRMMNALFEACKKSDNEAKITFLKTVKEAVNYTRTHFSNEEDYLTKINYPDLPEHKKQHDNFVTTLMDALKNYQKDNSEPIKLAIFLKDWLLNHILGTDKKYVPYILKNYKANGDSL